MNYWLISDTHFGHNKNNRPEGFEDRIMSNLRIIQPNDILIHLGDFCMGGDKYWHRRFMENSKAKKHWLIKGNHDSKSLSWYVNLGWDIVAEQILIKLYGKPILFSHQPRPTGDYTINIHGHLHSDNHRGIIINPHNFLIKDNDKSITLKSIIER